MGIASVLAKHLRQPQGFMGKIVGVLMNSANRYMNRHTIEYLNIRPNDHVLEIGSISRREV